MTKEFAQMLDRPMTQEEQELARRFVDKKMNDDEAADVEVKIDEDNGDYFVILDFSRKKDLLGEL
jgi:hypothetical protein